MSVGFALLAVMPSVFAESMSGRTEGPCFHVSVQNDPVNTSNVRQECDYNLSRTVQAGASNSAWTTQTGSVNNNKVRQYQYDVSRYFDPMGGRRAPGGGGANGR